MISISKKEKKIEEYRQQNERTKIDKDLILTSNEEIKAGQALSLIF